MSGQQARRRRRWSRGRRSQLPMRPNSTVGWRCTGAACSESDNPPVSSLCVDRNFICHTEGKRQPPHEATTTTTCSQREPPATEGELGARRQPIRSGRKKWISGNCKRVSPHTGRGEEQRCSHWKVALEQFIGLVMCLFNSLSTWHKGQRRL